MKSEEIFQEEKLFSYIKKFSYPRLAGSEGEKKAVKEVKSTFLDLGFKEEQIQEQAFQFSDFYSTTLMQFLSIININFVLVNAFLIYIYSFFRLIIFAIMATISLAIMKTLNHIEDPGFWGKYFGTEITATNVYAKIPAKNENKKEVGNIILSAHLDTKSQTFRSYSRMFAYNLWLFCAVILAIINAISFLIILELLSWILTFLIIGSNIVIILLYTDNKSPGALDNASGMSIVFELGSYFNNHPLNNFNIFCCQFNAEELGTMGSRFFVKQFLHDFKVGKTFQINYDIVSCAPSSRNNRLEYMVSYGLFPRKHKSTILKEYVLRSSEISGIKIKKLIGTIGAHTDSLPFRLKKYDAIDFLTLAASKYCHYERDTPEKVDPAILKDACIITKDALKLMDAELKLS